MSRTKALLVAAVLVVAVVLGATASPARSGATTETQLRSLNKQIAAAINAFRRAARSPHAPRPVERSTHPPGSTRTRWA